MYFRFWDWWKTKIKGLVILQFKQETSLARTNQEGTCQWICYYLALHKILRYMPLCLRQDKVGFWCKAVWSCLDAQRFFASASSSRQTHSHLSCIYTNDLIAPLAWRVSFWSFCVDELSVVTAPEEVMESKEDLEFHCNFLVMSWISETRQIPTLIRS